MAMSASLSNKSLTSFDGNIIAEYVIRRSNTRAALDYSERAVFQRYATTPK
jgi:hypothetical protein